MTKEEMKNQFNKLKELYLSFIEATDNSKSHRESSKQKLIGMTILMRDLDLLTYEEVSKINWEINNVIKGFNK